MAWVINLIRRRYEASEQIYLVLHSDRITADAGYYVHFLFQH